LKNYFLQVHLSPDDLTKIQLEFVPMLQEIIFEWLVIIFFAITPAAPAVTEDFNSKLSSLQIGRLYDLFTLYFFVILCQS
jgi:nuclear pore complex protein Nup160